MEMLSIKESHIQVELKAHNIPLILMRQHQQQLLELPEHQNLLEEELQQYGDRPHSVMHHNTLGDQGVLVSHQILM